MADTGIKAQFGVIRVSYEPISGYVILSTSNGQILRLESDEAHELKQAMDWVEEQKKRALVAQTDRAQDFES